MIRLPTLLVCLSLSPITLISCEEEWPDDECTCRHGGSIGGWEDSDTTVIFKKDSTAGFEISVEDWNDSGTHDIEL